MEKVTIQLEEVTVKTLDRFIELDGCDLTREEKVNVIILAYLGKNLCDMDDEFAESELCEEIRATIKRLDPVADKQARFKMVQREIEALLICYKFMEDEDVKNKIKQDTIEEVEQKQRCIDLIKELD